VAVGADVSIVIDALVTVALGFHLFPALSEMILFITGKDALIPFPLTLIETVPSVVHTTVNVIDVPAVAFGYGDPQVAVPELETVCFPQLIRSLKFAVMVTVRDFEGDVE
jgi:hypothetical protein